MSRNFCRLSGTNALNNARSYSLLFSFSDVAVKDSFSTCPRVDIVINFMCFNEWIDIEFLTRK